MYRRLSKIHLKNEGGFTLIEVIVALAILSIIAVGIYSALNASVSSSVNEDERATAKNLAEAQMEYVKDLEMTEEYWWDTLDTTGAPPTYQPSTTILNEYPGYTVNIARESTDRGPFVQLITVTVSHDEEVVWVLEGIKLVTLI